MTYITKDLQDVLSKHNIDVRLSETISYLHPSEAKRVRRENQEKLRLLVADSKKMEQICYEYYAVIQNIVPYEQKLIKKDTRALSELMKFQAETIREKMIAYEPGVSQAQDKKNIEDLIERFRNVVEKMKKYTVTLETRPFNDEVSSMLFHHIRENGKLALQLAKKPAPDVMLGESFATFLSKEMKQPLIKKNITLFAPAVEDGVQILLMDLIKKGKIAELAKEYGDSSQGFKLVNAQINHFFDLFGSGAHRLFTKAPNRDYDSIKNFIQAILEVQSQLIKATPSSEKKEEASYASSIFNTIQKWTKSYDQGTDFLKDIFSEQTYVANTASRKLSHDSAFYNKSAGVTRQFGYLDDRNGNYLNQSISPFRRFLLLRSFFKQAKKLGVELTIAQKKSVTSHIVGASTNDGTDFTVSGYTKLKKALGVLKVAGKSSIDPIEFMLKDSSFEQVKIGGLTADQREFEQGTLPSRYGDFSDSYKWLDGKYSGVPHDNADQTAFMPVVKNSDKQSQANSDIEKVREEMRYHAITNVDLGDYFSAIEASQGAVKIESSYVSALLTETNQIVKKEVQHFNKNDMRDFKVITRRSITVLELLKYWFKDQKKLAMNALHNIG